MWGWYWAPQPRAESWQGFCQSPKKEGAQQEAFISRHLQWTVTHLPVPLHKDTPTSETEIRSAFSPPSFSKSRWHHLINPEAMPCHPPSRASLCTQLISADQHIPHLADRPAIHKSTACVEPERQRLWGKRAGETDKACKDSSPKPQLWLILGPAYDKLYQISLEWLPICLQIGPVLGRKKSNCFQILIHFARLKLPMRSVLACQQWGWVL